MIKSKNDAESCPNKTWCTNFCSSTTTTTITFVTITSISNIFYLVSIIILNVITDYLEPNCLWLPLSSHSSITLPLVTLHVSLLYVPSAPSCPPQPDCREALDSRQAERLCTCANHFSREVIITHNPQHSTMCTGCAESKITLTFSFNKAHHTDVCACIWNH